MQPNNLNPIPQTRRRLGNISHSKFYEEVSAGAIRIVKIGRRSYVTDNEIERYVAVLEEQAGILPATPSGS